MKKILLILVTFCFYGFSFGQTEDAWVYFVDKPNAQNYLDNPLTMLTQRSLDRREVQGIALDLKDVPLESTYVLEIATATGIEVKARSKWMNALHIQGSQANINALLALSCVDSIEFANRNLNVSSKQIQKRASKFVEEYEEVAVALDYGDTENQVTMLNVDYLHDLGFKGEGISIAVIDAGFEGADTFSAFVNLHDSSSVNGEVLGGYNFVNRSSDFYADTGSQHGMSVLSTIAGYIENQFVGIAPNADFYLYVTEDAANETPLEESLWVEAAERADSLGVDIINTSLGYTEFDDSSYNYTYADMDGQTAFASRAATIGASRGMILVIAAGNEGSSTWHYISVPAEAVDVVAVGAVDQLENSASFSSYGPTVDNRVKPEVLAQGKNTYVINGSGNIATSNGTSFAAPITAGALACLWQANPDKTAIEIRQKIQESGDQYSSPTAQRGYGIPDFQIADQTLVVEKHFLEEVVVYPNPIQDFLYFNFPKPLSSFRVKVTDIMGRIILDKEVNISSSKLDLTVLEKGIYLLEMMKDSSRKTVKIIKS